MNTIDIIYTFIIEPLKYLIISYGILGFPLKKSKVKYMFLPYMLIGFCAVYFCNFDLHNFYITTSIFNLIIVFDAKFIKKVQAAILEWFFISIIDVFIFSITIFIFSGKLELTSYVTEYISNTIGFLVLISITILMKNRRHKINTYAIELPMSYFIMIILLLFCLSMNIGLSQGIILEPNLLYNKDTQVQKASLMTLMITTVLCIGLTITFVYNVINRRRLQTENELKEKLLNYQKKYYSELIQKDKGMRSFRHDFKKNIAAMQVLSDNNEFAQLKEYINTLNDNFKENQFVHSGNSIADYFINSTIEQVKKSGDLDFEILGNFPKNIRIPNIDFSILIGNAMDNAKEALIEFKGDRKLSIIINNKEEHLMIKIINSSLPKETDLLHTDKADSQNHGFGTNNMKRIVEKHLGEIEWSYQENLFTTEIFI